jgi:DNA-binding transcriptional ArsR family regulator
MTHAERHIIETYSELFESLSSESKLELLERLAKSIRKGRKSKEKDFFSSFGGFASEKPAEEIIKDIRESRKFRSKDLKI